VHAGLPAGACDHVPGYTRGCPRVHVAMYPGARGVARGYTRACTRVHVPVHLEIPRLRTLSYLFDG